MYVYLYIRMKVLELNSTYIMYQEKKKKIIKNSVMKNHSKKNIS